MIKIDINTMTVTQKKTTLKKIQHSTLELESIKHFSKPILDLGSNKIYFIIIVYEYSGSTQGKLLTLT